MNDRRIGKSDFERVMAVVRRKFGPGNPYGIYGFGIDRKVTGGRATKAAALNVYVIHKHEQTEQPAPTLAVSIRRKKLTIHPDVIGVGVEPRGHDALGRNPGSTQGQRSRFKDGYGSSEALVGVSWVATVALPTSSRRGIYSRLDSRKSLSLVAVAECHRESLGGLPTICWMCPFHPYSIPSTSLL